MRKTFVNSLLALCSKHPQLMVVNADLGYSVFEPFMQSNPDNYLNVGVAEADMVGIAAGLALCGKRPFCYSITPFIALRDLEQVRVDVCYHNLPVILVASGAGLCYGSLGPTHHGTEDMAVMRAMPNMHVFAPSDAYELGQLMPLVFELARPSYIRIGRSVEPAVHEEGSKPEITIGKATTVKSLGNDFAIISCGNMVWTGMQALNKLAEKGHKGTLISMHTVKPLDEKTVCALGKKMPIVTLEEHSIIGGLGSAVAECLVDNHIPQPKFTRIALADSFQHKIGSHEFLRAQNGLTPDLVAQKIEKAISK